MIFWFNVFVVSCQSTPLVGGILANVEMIFFVLASPHARNDCKDAGTDADAKARR